eukprot:gene30818-35854_t
MSCAAGRPDGVIRMDKHYACKWERWSDMFGDGTFSDLPAMDPKTACLMPDESGGCKDYMNAAVWQVMANLLCNG